MKSEKIRSRALSACGVDLLAEPNVHPRSVEGIADGFGTTNRAIYRRPTRRRGEHLERLPSPPRPVLKRHQARHSPERRSQAGRRAAFIPPCVKPIPPESRLFGELDQRRLRRGVGSGAAGEAPSPAFEPTAPSRRHGGESVDPGLRRRHPASQ